uniref:Small ribosomal subunit protein uS13m n=1 Tax=Entransia fimbriata TaxID=130991 RepID=U5YGP6_9VIRI|nr:ribosomal protein S13 [Entransia fimbriata]AGZ90305.1 ribosomal protein S13 [Entransia fimbriata]
MTYIYIRGFKIEKKIPFALRRIFGIGITRAKKICYQLGFSPTLYVKNLTAFQFDRIETKLLHSFFIGKDLMRLIQQDIQKLKIISSYRGIRHHNQLPCRGQRTHTNARTSRRLRRPFHPLNLRGKPKPRKP